MSQILINKEQVLRYLGYRNQGLDDITNGLINESIEEMRTFLNEKYVYKIFNIEREKDGLLLSHSNFRLTGSSIEKHLEDSESCILLALTLGHKVDTMIRYYEKTSMTKAMILDACASVAIEEIADRICDELEEMVSKDKKALTSRFSPGYGDLEISIQKDFLEMLESGKSIGLTASSHSILIPRKSVTAIIGIVDIATKKGEHSCVNCNRYGDCNYIKGDVGCGD